ncbi:putative patatin [Blastococcus saxobsidens DD2]|uniref:Putative patatin n=1 Tax=Blastococcus saxobsidens (strain DD2) TaxID=1146883 RepID=H6RKP2_BLASD|nr:putative patatin [Blastococcus saxobsidens DD2]
MPPMAATEIPGQGGRTAFVLGGGGVLGAAEIGMLSALFERGIRPDVIVGTSVGAINGALVAADPTPRGVDRLRAVWAELTCEGVFAGSVLARARTLVRTRTHPPARARAPAGPAGGASAGAHVRRADRAVPVRRGQHRAGCRALVHRR